MLHDGTFIHPIHRATCGTGGHAALGRLQWPAIDVFGGRSVDGLHSGGGSGCGRVRVGLGGADGQHVRHRAGDDIRDHDGVDGGDRVASRGRPRATVRRGGLYHGAGARVANGRGSLRAALRGGLHHGAGAFDGPDGGRDAGGRVLRGGGSLRGALRGGLRGGLRHGTGALDGLDG